jgi:hypothetical protein
VLAPDGPRSIALRCSRFRSSSFRFGSSPFLMIPSPNHLPSIHSTSPGSSRNLVTLLQPDHLQKLEPWPGSMPYPYSDFRPTLSMKPQDCKKFFGQIRHNKDKDEKPKLTFTRLTASFEAFVAYRCLADSAGFDVNRYKCGVDKGCRHFPTGLARRFHSRSCS